MKNQCVGISDELEAMEKFMKLTTTILMLSFPVGYRVKSLNGTQFRIWATQKIKGIYC